jgi:hypothetical protein
MLIKKVRPVPETIRRKQIIGIQENNIPSLDLRERMILAALAPTRQSQRFLNNPESPIVKTSLFQEADRDWSRAIVDKEEFARCQCLVPETFKGLP